jgi:hypothetical protein
MLPKPPPKPPKSGPMSLRLKRLHEEHDKDVARIFDRAKHKPRQPKGVWEPGRPVENSGMAASVLC